MSTRIALSSTVLAGYSILPYSESLSEAWDDFVERKSINGNFLHTRKFYDHNPQNRLDDKSYLFYKKNNLIGITGCALQNDNGRSIIISHPRSTYGGFIVSKHAGVEASMAIVQLFLEEARKNSVQEIIIKSPFRIFYKKPCDEFDYALWYFGFSVLDRQLEIAIPTDKSINIETGYTKGTRSGLHKAMEKLNVEESTDYPLYWNLLERTLHERYNTVPTHNYSQFCELLKSVGHEKIKLFVARKDTRVLAGVLLFVLNEVCVHAQYIAYDIAFQNERPLNILLHEISIWAQQNGYRYFNLGKANEDNGNVINFNLFKFKEGYGGRGVLRETLHLKL